MKPEQERCTIHLKITSQKSFHTSSFPVNDNIRFMEHILTIFTV